MMIARCSIALVAVVGCKSELNPAYCAAHETDPRCGGDAAVIVDGQADGSTIDASTCVGTGLYTVCLADQLPTSDLAITANIDTDSTVSCLHFQPPGWVEGGQPAACFVAGIHVTVSGTVTARGTRPLVIVATDTLTITGEIDASAKHSSPTTIPAGFDPNGCAPYVTIPADNANGGGGGAGASFTTTGGDGGTGNNAATQAGLHVAAIAAPTTLRAGCIGQNGGDGDNTGGGAGVGGNGGGAVFLVAGNSITLPSSATIDVSGAGGDNGGHHSGGGGAGSGGMLVLSSSSFSITGAKLLADGGGGASGGTNATGNPGSDPSNGTTAASGGTISGGASGGNGFFGTTDATAGGNGASNDGGGGGGGGGGYLQSNHPLTGAAVSPVEVVVP